FLMAIDIILVLLAVLGFWLGYAKGIVATLFSILEYVLAMVISIAFAPFLSNWMVSSLHMQPVISLVLATIIIFLLSILLLKWLTKKIESSLKKGRLSSTTKILGGVVMMIVVILFYSIMIWLVNYYGGINEKIKSASI